MTTVTIFGFANLVGILSMTMTEAAGRRAAAKYNQAVYDKLLEGVLSGEEH